MDNGYRPIVTSIMSRNSHKTREFVFGKVGDDTRHDFVR